MSKEYVVRAIALRGMLAMHLHDMMFTNGRGDDFSRQWEELSIETRESYCKLIETLASGLRASYGKDPSGRW